MSDVNIEVLNSNIEHLRSDVDEMRSESAKWRDGITRLLERLSDYNDTKRRFDERIRAVERFQWKFAGFVVALIIIFKILIA